MVYTILNVLLHMSGKGWPVIIFYAQTTWYIHTGQHYRYRDDLLALDGCRAPQFLLPSSRFAAIATTLNADRWQFSLRNHPEKVFVSYIVQGIRFGFRVGFRFGSVACHAATRNMPSASQCERKVSEFLASKCAAGRVLGPFDHSLLPMVHINRLGEVPKSTPGKWRLIVDLSYPDGQSPNDVIQEAHCSLTYISVDEAVRAVLRLGQGALLAKVDIRNAYRNVPVHPDDRWLLGMSWKGGIFIDTVLPFGLRSAPKIFNTMADALEWVVRENGVREIYHYLDDFLVLGAPKSTDCADGLHTLMHWTTWLGFPIAEEKVEGPSTRLTFLGIEIDSEALTLRLPDDKLRALLASWRGRRWCHKSELQSLAGKLQHATKVVRPGRTFLRQVFELLRATYRGHHHFRLNRGMRSDLAWWDLFLESWNGVSMLHQQRLAIPDHELYTDASGGYGCGALWASHWLQFEWPLSYIEVPIAPKELVTIVIACFLWGRAWQGQVVHVHSDNEAVVAVVNPGYSKDTQMMHLVRCLFFYWLHGIYHCMRVISQGF